MVPPIFLLPLRVPRHGLSRNVSIRLSQGVAKPSPSSLKNFYLYFNLVCSFPEVLVANFVHSLYSHNFPQALINKCLDHFQRGLVHAPSQMSSDLIRGRSIIGQWFPQLYNFSNSAIAAFDIPPVRRRHMSFVVNLFNPFVFV